MRALDFYAGPKALAQIREHGLRAQDIAAIPAAAGGPKGLILQALDQWLFGTWLPSAVRERSLIGASIGAWRMAAACAPDPVVAFERLGHHYSNQRYPKKPPPEMVSALCRQLLKDVIAGHESEIVQHPHYRLHLLAIRGLGPLSAPRHRMTAMAGFARATLANLRARKHLAAHMERVIVGDARDALPWMKPAFDAFTTHFVPLSETNLHAALLASATLPMVMETVLDIPSAPSGQYWDGGLIDYHLAYPYARMQQTPGDLVFYPHFVDKIVPGWLDKSLPWRHASSAQQGNWYDNVLMVSPSKAFLQTLPRKKLPDRQDFHYYGLDHEARIRDWKQAIAEAQRLRDELIAFVDKPDISLIKPL
jgi:predicted acylesterase/phospholipase RssA